MAPRTRPPLKSRDEVIASLLADGTMTVDEIAALAALSAADEVRKLVQQQQRLALPKPPRPVKTTRAKLTPPSLQTPLSVAPPQPPPEKPKDRYRIRNWKDYNRALVQRGSLTLWLDDAVLAAWKNQEKNSKPGRDETYSDTAIITMLTLKTVFRLPLRATQGLTQSLFTLANLALPVPNYSTLSRRQASVEVTLPRTRVVEPVHLVVDSSGLKVYGEGEWKVRKHGWSKRRTWCAIHIGVDAVTQEVLACVMSEHGGGDAAILPDVLAEVNEPLQAVGADGAYDTMGCYGTVEGYGARAIIPPRDNAVVNSGPEWAGRNVVIERCATIGRTAWKVESGYHRRSLAETAFFRLKTVFGERLSSRRKERQRTEGRIRCAALNRMTQLGLPDSYKVVAG